LLLLVAPARADLAKRPLPPVPTRRSSDLVWMLYSDLHRHKLTGKHEPNAETRALLERCVLFLETNLEFEWKSTHLSRSARVSALDRKSTRLNSSHGSISYAVFRLKNTTYR